MDFWIKAAQLLLSLSLLIVLHEFGHYIPARIFKTRVEKFYLFFDWKFSIFKKKIGDTVWGIGWLPLGGYVKIAGMIDESMDMEQMAKPAEPWEFRSKPAWQRLIIMLGGVTVNLLLGMIIYIFVVFTWGEEQIPAKDLKLGMSIHPYMEQYGVHSGDNILKVGDEKVMHFHDISRGILLRGARELTVQRPDGKIEVLPLPDDIDYKLFESGATRVADFRAQSTKVLGVFTLRKGDGFSKQSIIYKIGGKTLKNVDLDKTKSLSKTKVTFIDDGDTLTSTLTKVQFTDLLKAAPALRIGLLPSDKILKVNDQAITYFDEVITELYRSRKKTAHITVKRNGEEQVLKVYVPESASIGFAVTPVESADESAKKVVYYGFGTCIGKGIGRGYQTLSDYASQLKFVFTKKGASSMGGFGAIGGLFPSTWQWRPFWEITAFISIILAFMNVLPIPALDGGHVVFLLYEMITGKEAPEKVLEYAQYIGFFLILGLVLYANGNDIFKFFLG